MPAQAHSSLSIKSNPQGAEIVITDRTHKEVYRGTTPATVTLATSDGYFKGQAYTISLRMDGYDEYTAPLGTRIDGWYIGNIIFGGPIGLLVVDPLTGAMWALQSDEVDVALRSRVAQRETPEGSITIVSLDEVPEDARAKLVKVR